MGKRGWSPASDEEAAKLALAELDQRIVAAEWRFTSAGLSGQLRKQAFKHLAELEAIRERLHGVAAPERRLRSRR